MHGIYKSDAGAAAIRSRYREILTSWPVEFKELRLPTREGETFVVASGPADAPALVLLHGSGANAATWRSDIATWAQHLRVYAVDLVGEPGLSAQSRPRLDSEETALWLDDVLAGLGIGTASIAGMSLGGWVALDYAIRRPQTVDRLVLVCPGGVGRQTYRWLPKAIVLRALGRRGVRRTVRMVTGLDTPQTETILDDVVLNFEHFRPRTEKLPLFSDSALAALTVPILVIVGESDAMMDSAQTANRFRALVPQAKVTVLPDTGHAIIGQTERVLNFLT